MTRFSGKTAFVTGGSRGIGAAIVERLVQEGAKVAFTYSGSKEKAEALAAKLGSNAVAVKADVTDSAALKTAIDSASTTFGGLDILVNNAGVGTFQPITEITLEDYDATMNVNVRGVVAGIIAALPHLRDGGRIINISSVMAEFAAMANSSVYSMSKSALRGLVQGAARDLGNRRITINNVQPGPVDTDMNPAEGDFADFLHTNMAIKRHAKGAEIAGLVAYLASDEAAFITGANYTIDGGFSS